MQEINVDKIMEEIREEIKEKGMEKQKPEFADVSFADDFFEMPQKYDKDMMQKELLHLNGLWDTSLVELQSTNAVKKAVKQVLGRAVGVIMRPHVVEQVTFNAAVVNSINMLQCLAKENEDLKAEVAVLREQVKQLNETVRQNN